MADTLTRLLWVVAGAGAVALVAALAPSPLRVFDLFDEPVVIDVRKPPALKLRDVPPVAEFADIAARPLFNAGRKPDPAPLAASGGSPAATGERGELSAFRVVGIVADSVTQRAIVERKGSPSQKVAPGDRLGEWRIDKIDAAGIVVSRDGRTARLAIPRYQAPSGTP